MMSQSWKPHLPTLLLLKVLAKFKCAHSVIAAALTTWIDDFLPKFGAVWFAKAVATPTVTLLLLPHSPNRLPPLCHVPTFSLFKIASRILVCFLHVSGVLSPHLSANVKEEFNECSFFSIASFFLLSAACSSECQFRILHVHAQFHSTSAVNEGWRFQIVCHHKVSSETAQSRQRSFSLIMTLICEINKFSVGH